MSSFQFGNLSNEATGDWDELIHAIQNGIIGRVETWLNQPNINVNDQDSSNGWTLLQIATDQDQEPIVKLLLDHGASIDLQNHSGSTSLHMACFYSHKNLVSLLLDRGASINLPKHDGRTPLHISCFKGHHNIASLLLDRGASIDRRTREGWTPLHAACFKGYQELVLLLLSHGANRTLKNNFGKTAKDVAQEHGHSEIVKLLSDETESRSDLRNPTGTLDKGDGKIHHKNSYPDHNREKDVEMLTRTIEVYQGREKMRKAMNNNSPSSNAVIPYSYVEECTKYFTTMLGEGGGFGSAVVFLAQDQEDDMIQYAAVQKVTHDGMNSWQRDIETLRLVAHPNIIRTYGIASRHNNDHDVYLLLEYNSGSDVRNFLSLEEGRKKLSCSSRVNILCQVAQAMQFLHSGGVVDKNQRKYFIFHRNIQPSNICLDNQLNAKLGQGMEISDRTREEKGFLETMTSNYSNQYLCPQYKAHKVEFEGRCDVYSFGVVMMEILTGCLEDDLVLMYKLPEELQENFDPLAGSDWECVKKQLSDLTLSCVKYKLDSRPAAWEVIVKLNDLQMMTRKIYRDSFVSSTTPVPGPVLLHCQLCNHTCTDSRNMIVCVKGHTMDSSCFCNRSFNDISDFFKCPICNSVIDDPMTLTQKIPMEYLMLLTLKKLSQQEQDIQKNKNDIQVIHNEIGKIWQQMTVLAAENNPCPRYVLMVPTTVGNKEKKRNFTWLVSKPIKVYFVCEQSWKAVEAFEMQHPPQWVIQVAPVLKISLQILMKVGLNYVDPDCIISEAAIDFVKSLAETVFDHHFSNFNTKMASGIGLRTTNDTVVSEELFQNQQPVIEVLQESYQDLAQEADKHEEWKKKMKPILSPETGKIMWVLSPE